MPLNAHKTPVAGGIAEPAACGHAGNLGLLFAAHARSDRTAIVDLHDATKPHEVSFRELDAMCNAVARGLARAGLVAGDRIAVLSLNRIEFVATGNVRLLFGDQVRVVGDSTGLVRASEILGNSVKQLDHPQMIPVFVGIALGVMLGSIPVLFPGIPAPVKLGLAGGPLVAALVLSRLGRLGGMNFYMSHGANLMIRELGIVLFLACVGLKAGGSFVDTVIGGDGLLWMAWAAAITVVPVIVVGLFARLVLKLNFTALSGLIAGSMTDPPALAFANATTQSESPAVTYATVYPLTMILRVLSAQAFILFTL